MKNLCQRATLFLGLVAFLSGSPLLAASEGLRVLITRGYLTPQSEVSELKPEAQKPLQAFVDRVKGRMKWGIHDLPPGGELIRFERKGKTSLVIRLLNNAMYIKNRYTELSPAESAELQALLGRELPVFGGKVQATESSLRQSAPTQP